MTDSIAHALIIDDDPMNHVVMARLLERQGVSCTTVQHPALLSETLDALEACDIIFLDLEMPVMDGYEIFDILVTDDRLRAVPIVACTIHTDEITTARQVGMNGFIAKPLDAHRFPSQLARLLSGEEVWDAR